MLFTSPEFIFLFLPAAVTLHFAAARYGVGAAMLTTTATSLFFYGWWNPPYVLLLLGSIGFNFLLAILIQKSRLDQRARMVTGLGIVTNLSVLIFYKYWDFFIGLLNGLEIATRDIPLALSFTTFVQIAFLASVLKTRKCVDLPIYSLFVSFFPHLIAGPLVRWPHLYPQISDPARYRVNWDNIALGLTIFVLGLSKKVMIADQLALFVSPVFDAALRGDHVTAAAAWGGAVAFSLQLYFDFSGYSDMAVGLALLFNLRLPVNFATPFRATSIIELWHRWHISLSQFLRDFIYIPLGGSRRGNTRQSANLFITMVLGGLWHGAGLTFLAWGAFHGALLTLNHAWRRVFPKALKPSLMTNTLGWVLTFGAFAVGMVFFRAADMNSALHLLASMSGFEGRPPAAEAIHLDWDRWGIRQGYLTTEGILLWFGSTWTAVGTLWTAAALVIATRLPDTMEIVGYREGIEDIPYSTPSPIFAYQHSAYNLALVSGLLCGAFLLIGRVREFLYYQF